MALFEDNMENAVELEEWVQSMGIKCHSNLRIKNTKDRGIGVFFSLPNTKLAEDRIELLRCPRSSVYNIYTLRDMIGCRLENGEKNVLKKVLGIVFRNCGPSESNIIIAHFIAFLIVSKGDLSRNEWKKSIKKYLNVLLETNVGNLYTDQRDALNDFISDFQGNILLNSFVNELNIWEEIVAELNEELEEEVRLEEVLQICGAVRSRVLEIPRGVDGDDDGDDGGYEEDDGDYYVDVTLVPVLDFVNHDNKMKNAYFDVDKLTDDVILYFDKKGTLPGEEFEIFITYDENEDLHRMFTNYGFIPRSEKIRKVIEIPVLGYAGEGEHDMPLGDYEVTRRLFISKQSPNVQFDIRFDKEGEISECNIMGEEYYSYLAFCDVIDWDLWEEEEEQEAEKEDDENGTYERNYRKCYELTNTLSNLELSEAKRKFIEYVSKFMEMYMKKAQLGTELCVEYERPCGETSNLVKLLILYADIGSFVHTHYENTGASGVLKEGEKVLDEYEEGGEASRQNRGQTLLFHRLNPIYNFAAQPLHASPSISTPPVPASAPPPQTPQTPPRHATTTTPSDKGGDGGVHSGTGMKSSASAPVPTVSRGARSQIGEGPDVAAAEQVGDGKQTLGQNPEAHMTETASLIAEGLEALHLV